MNPLVSVVVPIYNVERYLRDCLDSVITQTMSQIEIVCVNDGSTDGSLSIAQQYAENDSRIVVIDQQNSGLSAARNAGIAAVRGQYVQFLDSDDLLVPNAIETLYALASSQRLDIIYYDASPLYETAELEASFGTYSTYYERNGSYLEPSTGPELFSRMVEARDWLPSACLQLLDLTFYRNAELAFADGLVHEDNLFSFQAVLQASRVAHCGQALYLRRIRADSLMTTDKSLAHVEGYLGCYVGAMRFVENRHFAEPARTAVHTVTEQMYRGAVNALCELRNEERAALCPPDSSPDTVIAYSRCNESCASLLDKRRLNRKLRECGAALSKIEKSRTYRLARALRKLIFWK